MKLAELKCTNCGAPLRNAGNDEYRCEHCGALYKVEGNPYDYRVIAIEHPHVHTLRSQVRIDEDDAIRYGEEYVARRAVDAMRHSMVEQLTDFLRLDKTHDPFTNSIMIRGTIRVVEPSFRF